MTFHYKEDEIKQRKRHIYYLRKVFKRNKKVNPAKIIRRKVFESKQKNLFLFYFTNLLLYLIYFSY